MTSIILIYDAIQALNNHLIEGSTYDEMLYEYTYKEALRNLPIGSKAYNILINNRSKYTSKQLWCIAYTLAPTEFGKEIIKKSNKRIEEKLSRISILKKRNDIENKDIFSYLEDEGMEIEKYKHWCRSTGFSKQYYSNHYTMHSAKVYINLYK